MHFGPLNLNHSQASNKLNKPRLLLSAFGIHTGGGFVLLQALANGLGGRLKGAALDARIQGTGVHFSDSANLLYVRKSFFARMVSLIRLASTAAPSDVLLCFNSLPPLFRPACPVILYVHAPHFANMHRGARYTLLTTIRIRIERRWFKFGVANCSEVWVQTKTMAHAMRAEYPFVNVKVVPFVDDGLAVKLSKIPIKKNWTSVNAAEFIFFYPADAVGHKNQANLLKAWDLMGKQGQFPKLRLTLTPEEFGLVMAQAGVEHGSLPNIENLGRISRDEVLGYMTCSSAMIFPSIAETFGLPMLEARALNVDILASERDFVRDVCSPAETFDPTSFRSISAAVCRFMKCADTESVSVLNADAFLNELLSPDGSDATETK